jgi:hypothetical protein
MKSKILLPGSSGPFVRDLQVALNNRLNPSPNLMVSGVFDPATGRAVRALQTAKWLEVDGVAGQGTLDALYDTETNRPILHNVRFLTQPTETTCWATSTAMLKGSTIAAIRMRTPAEMLNPEGALINNSENGAMHSIPRAFARLHGLQYHAPQRWQVGHLIKLLQKGPVMMELRWNPQVHRYGKGTCSHYCLIVGARGSHSANGQTTTLRIFNPYPPGQGNVLSKSYDRLLREIPLSSFGLMTR